MNAKNPQNVCTVDLVADLMKYLHKLWSRAHDECEWFYEEYRMGHAELENEPFDCDLSRARIGRTEDGNGVVIDYSAVHIYDSCYAYGCGPYDEEEVNVDEEYKQCEESCLEETERYAKSVLNEYKKVIERWAKKRGVAYTEELLRDELNFRLIIKLSRERPPTC
jgi:hypothetical protein